MGVGDVAFAAQKADQRYARPRRHVDRQARWRADRGQSGCPAMSAFCMISKPARPLTSRTWPASGSGAEERPADHLVHRVVPAHVFARPTSVPSASNSAAACSPPVRPNTSLGRAESLGQRAEQRRVHSRPSATRRRHAPPRVELVLPHTPQARGGRAVPRGRCLRHGRRQVDGDHVVALLGAQRRIGAARDPYDVVASLSSPSERRNPAASSKSAPGVRMVTTSDGGTAPGQPTRISSGSSVATTSARLRTVPPSTSRTRTRTVLPGRRVGSVMRPSLSWPPSSPRAKPDDPPARPGLWSAHGDGLWRCVAGKARVTARPATRP